VTDTGIGMPPAVLERAFDPFFTTKGHGNGLGLSQVLGFVQQSAGDVQLDSEEGRGTAVRLLFPAAASEDRTDGQTD
jgi:two-component system, NtrC family, sensor kinase